jgi:hypothetical protein
VRYAFALILLLLLAALAGCVRGIGGCDAASANGFSTTCSGPAGYVWNGSSCIYTRACNCTGDDCGSMYQSQDTCEAAHTHCVY